MCYFVSLGIDPRGREAVEALKQERGGFHVAPASNASVKKLFPPSDVVFEVTRGMCSCELIAGDSPDKTIDKNTDEARLRARYARQGWSAAKIERAIHQAVEHAHQTKSAPSDGVDYAAKFRTTVAELADRFGGVRLFIHMYDGDQTTERVKATGSTQAASVTLRNNASLAEDVLISVTAPTSRRA